VAAAEAALNALFDASLHPARDKQEAVSASPQPAPEPPKFSRRQLLSGLKEKDGRAA